MTKGYANFISVLSIRHLSNLSYTLLNNIAFLPIDNVHEFQGHAERLLEKRNLFFSVVRRQTRKRKIDYVTNDENVREHQYTIRVIL